MGRRKPIVPDWQLPWPPDQHGSGEPITLRKIITRVVLKEVEAFKDRQQERRFVRILTERQIEDGLNSKVLLLARDREIKDPNILDQIRSR